MDSLTLWMSQYWGTTILPTIIWLTFLGAFVGLVVATIALIEMEITLRARRADNSGKEILLIATSRRDMAIRLFAILIIFSIIYGRAAGRGGLLSNAPFSWEMMINSMLITAAVWIITEAKCRNYRNYRVSINQFEDLRRDAIETTLTHTIEDKILPTLEVKVANALEAKAAAVARALEAKASEVLAEADAAQSASAAELISVLVAAQPIDVRVVEDDEAPKEKEEP